MKILRAIAASAIVVLAVAVPAGPAAAAPILEEGDAVELANKLADATADQDVCYGWIVRVQDDDGASSGTDTGSSLGPGRSPEDPACSPRVVFVADIHYTSSFSEAADSARYHVSSTLAGFDAGNLGSLGVTGSGLLGSNDDLVVINATSLLPALVSDQGLAPGIVAEETTGTIPASDRPTGGSGLSDRLRTYWGVYLFTALLILVGLAWFGVALFLRSMQRGHPGLTLSSLFDHDD